MDPKLKAALDEYNFRFLYDDNYLTFKQMNEKAKDADAFYLKYAIAFVDKYTENMYWINGEKAKYSNLKKKHIARVIVRNLFETDPEIDLAAEILHLSFPKSVIDDVYDVILCIIGYGDDTDTNY